MLGALTNHLWQSTIFALAAALLTLAFRKNRANVRYALWLAASLKFLVPFALLIALGTNLSQLLPTRNAAPEMTGPAISQTIVQIAQPVSEAFSFAPVQQHATNWLFLALIAVWGCGFFAIGVMRFRAWRHIRAALRSSTPIDIPVAVEVRSAPGLLEPGVVGIFRPTLLLPEGILESLTPSQLEAVLAHELAHVRRRDNLTAALHMLVEAIFWFHPIVWWIGARLIAERERACDETVLSLGKHPRDYAEAILNVCKIYVESPLVCVSGITGASLKKRIHAILADRIAANLNFAKKSLLIIAGAAALALPLFVGMIDTPLLRAQSASADKPRFEVASVKPCVAGDVGFGGRGGGGNPGPQWSPGRLTVTCQPAWFFITRAYIVYADGQQHGLAMVDITTPVEGAPSWLKAERFTINAEVPGNASQEMMMGPMMQSLLEDRFRLKLHIDSKEVPAYNLVVAKGGPKLPQTDNSFCRRMDPNNRGQRIGPQNAPNCTMQFKGISMADFVGLLRPFMDRPIIDRTRISGKFDIQMVWVPDNPNLFPNAPDQPDVPSIPVALKEQLGLELVPAKGFQQTIVIDHIEKPTPN